VHVDEGSVRTPQDLTAAIQAAQTAQQLRAICMLHRSRLNYIHAAAAITRLAKLNPFSPQRQGSASVEAQNGSPHPAGQPYHVCITDVANLVATRCAEFQPRALANALWASSKLAVRLQQEQQQQRPPAPSHTALTAVLDLAACLCSLLPQLAPGFEPQHCANALHALASLQQVHDQQLEDVLTSQQQQQQHTDRQQHEQQQERAEQQAHTLQLLQHMLSCAPSVLQATGPRQLAGMAPQGLANTLHAVARLGLSSPEEAWMDVWLDAAQVGGCTCVYVLT